MKQKKKASIKTWQALIVSMSLASCGQVSKTGESRDLKSVDNSEDGSASKPEMTVEDVVQAFEIADQLPDQDVSDADRASWEASLIQGDKLKPDDAEIMTAGFSLDTTVDDQREIIDLRPNDTGIRNQGSEGTCTAFATVATIENLVKRFYGQSVDLSERHHWTTYADYQSTSSLKLASKSPIVSEATWPYNGRRPSTTSGMGVAKLNAYTTTKLSLQPIVEQLKKGQPVVIAVGVLTSMMNPKKGGIITGGSQKAGAGHAIALTGAIIDSRVAGGGYFIIKNSWGSNWGDKGYGYASFDYCQRTWCSAYSIADVSMYKDGVAVAKPSEPSVPTPSPTPVPKPVPSDSVPTPIPAPSVDPVLTAADFKLVGHPSHRRGFFGMTSFYLTIEAKPEIMKKIKSIRYSESGSYYTVQNSAAADVPVSIDNMSSPDFRTRGRSFDTDDVVIKLRDGKSVTVSGIKVNL